jgi:hypothetical protein
MLAYSQRVQVEKLTHRLGMMNALFILALFGIFAATNEFTRREVGHAPCIFEAFELVAIFLNLPARLLGHLGLGSFIPQMQSHTHHLLGYIFWSVLAYVQWRMYPKAVYWLSRHRQWLQRMRPVPILATVASVTVLGLLWPKLGNFEGNDWERLMLIPVYVFSLAGLTLTLLLLSRLVQPSDDYAR